MTKNNILGEFSRNADGRFFIKFSDAAYVRSDIIIFEQKDSSVHAVLHGSSHLIGYLDKDLAKGLVDNSDVILAAPHYFSGTVELTTKVSVN
jgi:hypothetical protein